MKRYHNKINFNNYHLNSKFNKYNKLNKNKMNLEYLMNQLYKLLNHLLINNKTYIKMKYNKYNNLSKIVYFNNNNNNSL